MHLPVTLRVPLLVAANALAVVAATPPSAPDPVAFAREIQPFLKRYCLDCHSSDLRKGAVDLEALADVAQVDRHGRRTWESAFRQLRAGAMPPDKELQPTTAERAQLVSLLESRLSHIDLSRPLDPGRVTARRLNRAEYDRTIRDLFGIRLTLSNNFPSDDVGFGFDNIGDVHTVSPLRLQRFLEAAESVSAFLLNTGRRLEMNRNEQTVFFERIKVVKSSDAGVVIDLRGKMTGDYETPLPGTYELQIRAWGLMPDSVFKARKINESNGWPQFPNAFVPGEPEPLVPLQVWADGKLIDEILIAQGESSLNVRTYTTRLALSMGVHPITFSLGIPAGLSGEARAAWIADPPRLGVKEARMTGPHAVDHAALHPLHRLLVETRPGRGKSAATAAHEILAELLPRAFRRPTTRGEIEGFVRLVESQIAAGEPFASAMEAAVQAVLISPNFLFRLEVGPHATNPGLIRPVGDYALASRLSYFLWGSMPDQTLFDLAASGRLEDDATLRAQVTRMMADPRAVAFKQGFFRQWLDLRKLRSLSIDLAKFPDFSEDLRADVETETLLFIGSIIDENRSIRDLLRADYTFVNDPLAKLYGLPVSEKSTAKTKDRTFRRVSLTDVPRRGLLTQASILMLTSYPNRTSPTKRGNWILEAILGDEPPPPPPNVPQLEEATANRTALPLRAQLKLHRTNRTCAACHETMDSIGLGLENYDAIGRWRTTDEGQPIDATGALPGGKKFGTPVELLEILGLREEDFARCLTQKLLTFSLGRGLEFYDRIAVEDILSATRADGHRMVDLVTAVVLSRPFRFTREEAPASAKSVSAP